MLVMRAAAPKLAVSRGLAPRGLPPAALTIGNFDGVHLGHQAMLARLDRGRALARPCRACVLTFEPHPREFFAPDDGADAAHVAAREARAARGAAASSASTSSRFDDEFAALAPGAFIERVLVRALGARWLLVGDDFRFGARRAGDFALLRPQRASAASSCEAMPTVADGGVRVSSSAVREALAAGDLERAARAARPRLQHQRPRRARRRSSAASSASRPPTCR